MYLFFLFSFTLATSLFADEVPSAPPDRSLMQNFVLFAIIGIFFYFILFRPEQKRRKAAEELRSKMKKGDRVTAMGIVGTIVKVQENTVVVAMYDGSKLEFLKGAISEVHASHEALNEASSEASSETSNKASQ